MITMPVKGFKSLTISEEDYRLLQERAERQGVSMAHVIGDLLRGLEGSDEPRVVETPSAAPEVDVVGLEGQIRLLRAEMAKVVDRVSRLEGELEEALEEEPELEEPYPVEDHVPEDLMEDLKFIRELKEWCEAVYNSRIDSCVNARSDRCPLKRGAPPIYCALFCVDYKVREPILF